MARTKTLVQLAVTALLLMNTVNTSAAEPITYRVTKVDGQDVFYREAGPKDAPTILFLHGLPSSSRMYQPLLESKLSKTYHLVAPDYVGFGHSSWPDSKEFKYTFDNLASIVQHFCEQLHLDHYTLFMEDYGGPIGFKLALAHPERVQAMIVQNAVAHQEGLSPLWAVRKAFWEDRAGHEAALRKNLVSLEASRQRHVGNDPNPERYNPDLWVDEYYFLNRPGQADIQSDLFYDYQNNVKAYPIWQAWLRKYKPPMLVVWGRYDPSFTVEGAEAYKKDDPNAQVHILDAGHFAIDQKADQIIDLTEDFMQKQHP